MIMRIFQVVTKRGKEEEFGRFFTQKAIPMMKGTKGILQVLPGAPRPENPREFSFVMVWEDLDALKAFAGEDYASPHIDPAEADLVETRSIKHYELAEA
ncbi:antibiotic biosynthesis monooxygenase family protein [Limimaricola sp.]|uniref:antibiotic biosynthesis monooxygenase family protein n=1 Tax=Limimaricola sp. TaxID=2211665 RepID=UPI004058D80A